MQIGYYTMNSEFQSSEYAGCAGYRVQGREEGAATPTRNPKLVNLSYL
jgi:hypothetical protein